MTKKKTEKIIKDLKKWLNARKKLNYVATEKCQINFLQLEEGAKQGAKRRP